MNDFMKFLKEQAGTTKYIAVQYDDETQLKLRNWAQENDFDLSTKFDGSKQPIENFDFHTTIFYSTSKHDMKNEIVSGSEQTAKVVGFELLGVDKDIPVLKVEGDGIRELRKHYEAMGMKDEWPSYTAHISVSYARENLPDIDKITLPTFSLTHSELKIADAK